MQCCFLFVVFCFLFFFLIETRLTALTDVARALSRGGTITREEDMKNRGTHVHSEGGGGAAAVLLSV